MNYAEVKRYSDRYGDAFYVYDEARFARNYDQLLSAFRRHYRETHIAYSYKTNYTPSICQKVHALGGYAEVVSAMEYGLARRLGVEPKRIVYNGPWKSAESLREALAAGSIVNLDSGRDLQGLQAVAAELPAREMTVGIRCNFPLKGHPDSRFGFDIEGAPFQQAIATIRQLPNVSLAGLHCHFPHRDLASFADRAERMVELARRVFPTAPRFLSIGGGFFGELPLSLKSKFADGVPGFEDYARVVGAQFAAAYGTGPGAPILFVEPGTALVADTFHFVARVIDTKEIRGKQLACVAGSMFNISPYSRSLSLPVTHLRREGGEPKAALSSWDIVGYTCIEGDVLSKGVPGPMAVGDFVMFGNVGSYSIVMKPPFILPSVPIIMRPDAGSGSKLIKRAESMEYIFENFVF